MCLGLEDILVPAPVLRDLAHFLSGLMWLLERERGVSDNKQMCQYRTKESKHRVCQTAASVCINQIEEVRIVKAFTFTFMATGNLVISLLYLRNLYPLLQGSGNVPEQKIHNLSTVTLGEMNSYFSASLRCPCVI